MKAGAAQFALILLASCSFRPGIVAGDGSVVVDSDALGDQRDLYFTRDGVLYHSSR